MKSQLSPKDWVLLSSYLDDELSPREKSRVEARLKSRADYRKALDGLRGTKLVLRRAIAHKIPHNFTLPASMAQTKPSRALRLVPTLRLSSAVVALVSVFLMVGTLLTGLPTGLRMAAVPADMAAKEPVMLEAAEAPAAEQAQQGPPVVYWGGPPTPPQASGMGGAGEPGGIGGGDGFGSGPVTTYPYQTGIGGGAANTEPTMAMPTPAPERLMVQPTPAADSGFQPTVPVELPLSGSDPILGVAPIEKQGEILPETNRQMLPAVMASEAERAGEKQTQSQPLPILIVVGIGLLLIAVALFVTGMILRRNALH